MRRRLIGSRSLRPLRDMAEIKSIAVLGALSLAGCSEPAHESLQDSGESSRSAGAASVSESLRWPRTYHRNFPPFGHRGGHHGGGGRSHGHGHGGGGMAGMAGAETAGGTAGIAGAETTGGTAGIAGAK